MSVFLFSSTLFSLFCALLSLFFFSSLWVLFRPLGVMKLKCTHVDIWCKGTYFSLIHHLHKSSLSSKEHMVALPYQAFVLSVVNQTVLWAECWLGWCTQLSFQEQCFYSGERIKWNYTQLQQIKSLVVFLMFHIIV